MRAHASLLLPLGLVSNTYQATVNSTHQVGKMQRYPVEGPARRHMKYLHWGDKAMSKQCVRREINSMESVLMVGFLTEI